MPDKQAITTFHHDIATGLSNEKCTFISATSMPYTFGYLQCTKQRGFAQFHPDAIIPIAKELNQFIKTCTDQQRESIRKALDFVENTYTAEKTNANNHGKYQTINQIRDREVIYNACWRNIIFRFNRSTLAEIDDDFRRHINLQSNQPRRFLSLLPPQQTTEFSFKQEPSLGLLAQFLPHVEESCQQTFMNMKPNLHHLIHDKQRIINSLS